MPAHSTVDAVLFDMDGTLLDSEAALLGAYRDATTEVLGTPFPDTRADADRIIQLRARDAFPAIAGGDLEQAARIEAAFHVSYRSRESQVHLYEGVEDALRALRDLGVTLGIATSKSRVRFDTDLERTGITELFAVTVCGDEVTAAKPDPAPLRMALDVVGVAPERALYVGDGANDVMAAQAAGLRAVGVAYGFHPKDCRAAGPEHWIETPSELVELVDELRSSPAHVD